MANILHIVRRVALGLTLSFSFVVLGLSAYITNATELAEIPFYYIFALLSLIVAVFSIITIIPMIIIDRMRTGAFTSKVWVELVWLSILWVLWIASAAETATFFQTFFGGSCGFLDPDVNAACQKVQAVMAFDFLAWIALLGYTVTLFVFAVIGANRGHGTWNSTVKEGGLLGGGAAGAAAGTSSTAPSSMQEHKYPPSGTPPVQGYPVASPGPQGSVYTTAPQQPQGQHQPVYV